MISEKYICDECGEELKDKHFSHEFDRFRRIDLCERCVEAVRSRARAAVQSAKMHTLAVYQANALISALFGTEA